MKNKRKPKIFKDHKGEFIRQSYFVGGRQKFNKIYVINGIPADEYYARYADPITLIQNGDYDLLYARELADADAGEDEVPF